MLPESSNSSISSALPALPAIVFILIMTQILMHLPDLSPLIYVVLLEKLQANQTEIFCIIASQMTSILVMYLFVVHLSMTNLTTISHLLCGDVNFNRKEIIYFGQTFLV